MPIQQLDWRKALAAIGMSLFLAIAIIMFSLCCTANPIPFASNRYDNSSNCQTDCVIQNKQNAIEENENLSTAKNLSEMEYAVNATSGLNAPNRIASSLNSNSTHRVTVDTIKAIFLNSNNFANKPNASTSSTKNSNDHRTFAEIKSQITFNDRRNANETLNSMNNNENRSSTSPATELNLDSMNEVKQEKFKTLTSETTTTNVKINDQTNATTIAQAVANATADVHNGNALYSSNVIKPGAEISNIYANESLSLTKSTFALEIHQSTDEPAATTTKPTIQSVFLEYSNNNFNETNVRHTDTITNQQFSISKSKTSKIGSNNNNASKKRKISRVQYEIREDDEKNTDDNAILSRTDRSVHLTPNNSSKRKRPLRNDTANVERIERSANLSLSKATKRIQILMKSRFLQLLPDGTVNGTQNDESEYSK